MFDLRISKEIHYNDIKILFPSILMTILVI